MKKKKLLSTILIGIMSIGILAGCGKVDGKEESKELNIYTARHYESDDKLYEEFEKETGIKVNVVKGKAPELMERMKREGKNGSADLFVTVDGGYLDKAKSEDLLQPVDSEEINKNVPIDYRDKENYWTGLSTRARVIVYNKEKVKEEELSTYEDLATPKWKGKVLARSSSSLYNQSLLASLIELDGADAATSWAEGIVSNFAREPKGNDRDQAKAVIAGIGDVAIMNTYYIGLLQNSTDEAERKVGEEIGVFFPNQDTTGTHLNISGMGVTKHAKNKENAVKFIEYMTSKNAQELLIQSSYEFPVNKEAELPKIQKEWGEFKKQDIDYGTLGKYNKEATEIFDRVGWK